MAGRDMTIRSMTRYRCTRRVRRTAGRKHFFLTVIWYCFRLRCSYRPGVGVCPLSLKVSPEGRPVKVVMFGTEHIPMKRVSLSAKPVAGQAVHIAAVESDVLGKFPSLIAHCSVVKYDDGEPRQPGWVQVKTQGAAWIVQLIDFDACAQIQALGQTLDDALVLADALVAAEDAPWEPAQWLLKARKIAKK